MSPSLTIPLMTKGNGKGGDGGGVDGVREERRKRISSETGFRTSRNDDIEDYSAYGVFVA